MKRLLIFAAVLLFSSIGFAEGNSDNGSQYQHQTRDGAFELTPELSYNTLKLKYSSGSSDIKGLVFGATGEYGLNDMFSLGLTLRYAQLNVDTTSTLVNSSTKEAGLGDPDVFLNGRAPAGDGSLRFGTHLTIATEDSKTEANGDENAATGGMILTPFVGYEIKSGVSTFGARIAYQLWKEDAKYTNDMPPASSGKVKDGNILTTSIFYEANLNPTIIGGDLQMVNTSKGKKVADDGTVQDNSSSSSFVLEAYGAFLAAPTVTILPTVSYIKYTSLPDSYDSMNGFSVKVAGRFEF